VVDDSLSAEILLCRKHLGRAVVLIRRQAAVVKLARKIGGGR
jgi:hypothetical protein